MLYIQRDSEGLPASLKPICGDLLPALHPHSTRCMPLDCGLATWQ